MIAALALSAALAAQAPATAAEQRAELSARLAQRLDALCEAAGYPGASFAVVLKDDAFVAVASGFADREAGARLDAHHRMLAGSVGKTFVSALALHLAAEKALDLDAPVRKYLDEQAWFARLPNAEAISVRMLMNHTSGLTRYELREEFIADLRAAPDRVWKPEELVAYLLDEEAPFAAGEGWDYSDTNYIVLGMILEQVGRAPLVEQIRARYLAPLRLADTLPSRREIPRLAQGYCGKDDPFVAGERVLEQGRFAFDPAWEWAGGGYASTAGDLARWADVLYEGRAFPASQWEAFLAGVDAPALGRSARYGLGVILRTTPLGAMRGHSGFFPGYVTEIAYFPERELAAALMINTSDFRAMRKPPFAVLLELAELATY